jgi:hypothetical protein
MNPDHRTVVGLFLHYCQHRCENNIARICYHRLGKCLISHGIDRRPARLRQSVSVASSRLLWRHRPDGFSRRLHRQQSGCLDARRSDLVLAGRRHPALNLATREVPPVGGAASNSRRICRRNGLRFSKARTLGCPLILLTRSLCPLIRLLRLCSMALRASLLRPSASPCVDVGLRGVVLRLVSRVGQ